MFGSETLDAAAIGAGAALLGGIVAGLFSLITTWLGSKSKRSELAFEKRLEAFRQVSTAISEANDTIQRYVIYKTVFKTEADKKQGYLGGMYTPQMFEHLEKDFSYCKRKFEKIYHSYRVYLPPVIDNAIQDYIKNVLYEPVQLVDFDTFASQAGKFLPVDDYLKRVIKLRDKHTKEILEVIQNFIGYK